MEVCPFHTCVPIHPQRKSHQFPSLILFDGDFITMISEISGSHGCEHEDYTFLGCSAV
jgi:hypothetical protein